MQSCWWRGDGLLGSSTGVAAAVLPLQSIEVLKDELLTRKNMHTIMVNEGERGGMLSDSRSVLEDFRCPKH